MTRLHNTIGGTAAAAGCCAHLGVPYFGRSIWDGYLAWKGTPRPFRKTESMQWGNDLEAGILRWYEREQRPGWSLRFPSQMGAGHYHASLDAIMRPTRMGKLSEERRCIVVDAKRAVMRKEHWGTSAEPKTPLGYQVQLSHYGLVLEARGYTPIACDLAIYDPLADSQGREAGHVRSFRWEDLRPLALEWRAIVEAERLRWVAGGLPDLDGSDSAQWWQAIHNAPPRGKGRPVRPADAEERQLIEWWRTAAAEEKRSRTIRKRLAQELTARADGHRLEVPSGGYVQAQSAGGGHRFDVAMFRARHPDLYQAYKRPQPRGVSVRGYRFPEENPTK